jgi:23S rRNA (pseudouridine1915-N3)-methyltransferase
MPRSRIRLVTVGRLGEAYLREGMAEYEKRLRPFCSLELVELKDEGLKKEGERLEKYAGPDTYLLDVEGKELDSLAFSKLVCPNAASPTSLTFIIGSAEGIEERIKKKCRLISLSRMTFTHEMCRLFLVEQIYRGFMIGANRPYHK